MMDVAKIIVLAMLAEGTWESSKMVWKDKKINVNQVGTLVIGVVMALLAGANLPGAVGIELPDIAGQIVTGVLISRGSNYLHDLVAKLNTKQQATNTEE